MKLYILYSFSLLNKLLFFLNLEREKKSSISGDEPGLYKDQGRNSLNCIAANAALLSYASEEDGYVPTVGRWGTEWPS